jgi:hypothetical protein
MSYSCLSFDPNQNSQAAWKIGNQLLIKKSPLLFFFTTLAAIGIASLFGPEEKALGANVRYVYIHGAWVLAAQAALVLAGLAGFAALLACYLPLLAAAKAACIGGRQRWGAAALSFGSPTCRFPCSPCRPTGTVCSWPSRASAWH